MTLIAAQKMVLHKANGEILKGTSYNFAPTNEIFHLVPVEEGEGGKSLEIKLNSLKALFFVKSFTGRAEYQAKKTFQDEGIKLHPGRKVTVEFIDGEKLNGIIFTYDAKKIGFWLFPIDPEDNNERIFIISNMVKELQFI